MVAAGSWAAVTKAATGDTMSDGAATGDKMAGRAATGDCMACGVAAGNEMASGAAAGDEMADGAAAVDEMAGGAAACDGMACGVAVGDNEEVGGVEVGVAACDEIDAVLLLPVILIRTSLYTAMSTTLDQGCLPTFLKND